MLEVLPDSLFRLPFSLQKLLLIILLVQCFLRRGSALFINKKLFIIEKLNWTILRFNRDHNFAQTLLSPFRRILLKWIYFFDFYYLI